MRQDQRGCRRVLVDWTLGFSVLVLSVIALVVMSRCAGEVQPTTTPTATEEQDGGDRAHADDLRARIEDALRE